MSPRSLSLCALAALCLLAVSGVRAQEESPAAAEAKHLYQVALVALKAGDFVSAEDKLLKAAALVPSNALIFFNLAVVQSKTDHVDAAIASLRRAQELGLPADTKDAAELLAAELEYRGERSRTDNLVSGVYRRTDTATSTVTTRNADGTVESSRPYTQTIVHELRAQFSGLEMSVVYLNAGITYSFDAVQTSPTACKVLVRKVEVDAGTCDVPTVIAGLLTFDPGKSATLKLGAHAIHCTTSTSDMRTDAPQGTEISLPKVDGAVR